MGDTITQYTGEHWVRMLVDDSVESINQRLACAALSLVRILQPFSWDAEDTSPPKEQVDRFFDELLDGVSDQLTLTISEATLYQPSDTLARNTQYARQFLSQHGRDGSAAAHLLTSLNLLRNAVHAQNDETEVRWLLGYACAELTRAYTTPGLTAPCELSTFILALESPATDSQTFGDLLAKPDPLTPFRAPPSESDGFDPHWFAQHLANQEAELVEQLRQVKSRRKQHEPSVGAALEHALAEVLSPLLKPVLSIETNSFVRDMSGSVSSELDLVVRDNQHFHVSYSKGEPSEFLIEGVVAAVEVKQRLNKRQLHDSWKKCRMFKSLKPHHSEGLSIQTQPDAKAYMRLSIT